MATPPFNQKQWRAENELTDDPRWAGYTVPPTGNANYAWILNMVSKLCEKGVAGFACRPLPVAYNTLSCGRASPNSI